LVIGHWVAVVDCHKTFLILDSTDILKSEAILLSY